MKIAICEDDNTQIKLLQYYIDIWNRKHNIVCEVYNYPSSEAFLFAYDDMKFDLILLDIQMKEINGIELAKIIRSKKDQMAIIFITGIADYVFEGYNVYAINYLLKPIDENKLYDCLDKALMYLNKEKPYIIIEDDEKIIKKIYVEDVLFLESMKHDCIINCKNENIITKKSIKKYEEILDKNIFYRCHRSYIINISKVASISKKEVLMENKNSLPIARGKWEYVNKLFLKYYRGNL